MFYFKVGVSLANFNLGTITDLQVRDKNGKICVRFIKQDLMQTLKVYERLLQEDGKDQTFTRTWPDFRVSSEEFDNIAYQYKLWFDNNSK